MEEAEEACGLGKTRSLQQVTRGLSSSCPSAEVLGLGLNGSSSE